MATLIPSLENPTSRAFTSPFVSAGTPPFTPASISGLALWLDAADTATITQSSGLVSQWNDKSGNARHATQATGANQPVTNTRTIGGRNAIEWTGATKFFDIPNSANNWSGARTMVFCQRSPVETFQD